MSPSLNFCFIIDTPGYIMVWYGTTHDITIFVILLPVRPWRIWQFNLRLFSRLIDKILTKFLFSNQKIRFGNFKKARFNQNKTMEDHYMDRPKRMPFKRSESWVFFRFYSFAFSSELFFSFRGFPKIAWAKNFEISFCGSVFDTEKHGHKIFQKFELFGFLRN